MKPELTLSELEREPIVYFGCTWTEIQRAVRRPALLVVPAVGLAFGLGQPLALIPAVLAWVLISAFMLRQIRTHRAGKPLYYEQHRRRAHHTRFIRAQIVFQAERTRLHNRP